MNILLFAGTTEGRLLAERLARLPVRATVCVATEYGAELLADFSGRLAVRSGVMDAAAMLALLRETRADCVIDATHPYAVAASANIRAAADEAGVRCLRLARKTSPLTAHAYFDSAQAAAAALAEAEGNVLLTTGVKELAAFAAVPGHAARMYPRVLPAEESFRACAELGFLRSHVIAMQGPFSRELNLALMRQFSIAVLVTKDGGAEGGFPEKILAAEDAGVRVFIIGRPAAADGLSLEEVLAAVDARLLREGAQ